VPSRYRAGWATVLIVLAALWLLRDLREIVAHNWGLYLAISVISAVGGAFAMGYADPPVRTGVSVLIGVCCWGLATTWLFLDGAAPQPSDLSGSILAALGAGLVPFLVATSYMLSQSQSSIWESQTFIAAGLAVASAPLASVVSLWLVAFFSGDGF
jgi:hypothetical protein